MKRVSCLLLISIVVCSASSLPAAADSIFNNFGPNSNYNCCVGGIISGPKLGPASWITQANQFTAAVSGNVWQISIALGYVEGALNGATVSLWTDKGGVPGSLLGAWDIVNLPRLGTCCAVSAITGITGISVTAGQTYFLMAAAPGDTFDGWNWNTVGDTGLVDFSYDGGATWHQAPDVTRYAFSVLSVPEPRSLFMLSTALLAAGCTMQRRFVPGPRPALRT